MRSLILCSFSLLLLIPARAQKAEEDFQIALPEQKVANSLYNNIEFLDGREDTSHLGIVQLGAFNRKAKVVPAQSLGSQITNIFNQLIDPSARDGELLFYLRQLSFAEITGATSEKGYCYLRAVLFAKQNGAYKEVSKVDTVVFVKSMDVTRALFRNGSKAINEFISASLTVPASDPQLYSYADIIKLDSLEKRRLAAYNTDKFADGVYQTYSAFSKQLPDVTDINVKTNKNGFPESVRAANAEGKGEKIKAKDIYALVYKGKPYIATDYGYYPLNKEEDDFYFTGKAKVQPSTASVVAASAFFGILGGLLVSATSDALFEMKIDHASGGFIRLREVSISL